jgi:hypothetical protein
MEVSDSSTPLNSTRSRVVRLLLASSHEPVEVIRRKGVVKFNPSFFEMVRHRASARCAKRLCAERRLCTDGSPLWPALHSRLVCTSQSLENKSS